MIFLLQLESKNGIDCSNMRETKRVLLLLKLREQAVNNFRSIKEMTPETNFERNYDETYITWHKIMKSHVNQNEGTLGIFGSFPFHDVTCTDCKLGPCLEP